MRKHTFNCGHCGTERTVSWSRRTLIYCSVSCAMQARTKSNSTKVMTCAHCKRRYLVDGWAVQATRKYCSTACKRKEAYRLRCLNRPSAPVAEAMELDEPVPSYTDDPRSLAEPYRPFRMARPLDIDIRSSAWWV